MLRLATIILSLIGLISGQSIIVAYSDANCQVPIRNLVGSFDGICQSTLAGAGSFKITQLDPSCVVTFYPYNAQTPCPTNGYIGLPNLCSVNASVVAYSIDGCAAGAVFSSSIPLAAPVAATNSRTSDVAASSAQASSTIQGVVIVTAATRSLTFINSVGSTSVVAAVFASTVGLGSSQVQVQSSSTTGTSGISSTSSLAGQTGASGNNSLQQDSNNATSNIGLSTGAKAGIAVGAVIAVLVIVGLVVLFKKFNVTLVPRRKEIVDSDRECSEVTGTAAMNYSEKPELDGGRYNASEKQELDTSVVERAELDNYDGKPPAELDSRRVAYELPAHT